MTTTPPRRATSYTDTLIDRVRVANVHGSPIGGSLSRDLMEFLATVDGLIARSAAHLDEANSLGDKLAKIEQIAVDLYYHNNEKVERIVAVIAGEGCTLSPIEDPCTAWHEGYDAGFDYATDDHTPGGTSIDSPECPYED